MNLDKQKSCSLVWFLSATWGAPTMKMFPLWLCCLVSSCVRKMVIHYIHTWWWHSLQDTWQLQSLVRTYLSLKTSQSGRSKLDDLLLWVKEIPAESETANFNEGYPEGDHSKRWVWYVLPESHSKNLTWLLVNSFLLLWGFFLFPSLKNPLTGVKSIMIILWNKEQKATTYSHSALPQWFCQERCTVRVH